MMRTPTATALAAALALAVPFDAAPVDAAPADAAPPLTACVPAVTTCPVWSDLYDGPPGLSDWAMASAMDRPGRSMYVAGWSTPNSTSVDAVVVGYDAATGVRKWTASQRGVDGLPVAVWSTVQATPDGGTVLAAGTSYSSEKCRVVVTAYDGRTGNPRWSAPQPVGPAPCEYYTQSALAPDGRTFYVTTDTAVPATGGEKIRNGLTLAFDSATGRRLWATRTTGPTQNWQVTTAPDGRRVYVVGDVIEPGGIQSVGWRVYGYDARTGRELWRSSYACARNYGSAAPVQERPSRYCSMPTGLAATADRVFIEGSNAFGWAVTQVAAFDGRTGRALWHADRDPLRSFVYLNRALVVTADGRGVVAGRVRLDATGVEPPQFVVERLTAATGAVEWTRAVAGNTHSMAYCGGCGPVLGTDGSRQVFVTGAYPLGDSILTTAGVDLRTGTVAWSAQHVWHA
ncbi:MAG TPA: PQQ-binding-like beta-propeller repeat protein, partial [Micromonosporaceae bacterium]|nr:PQQ-binding-like beta-propeller repeat protein [Micromonosporaceae bacterium]